MSDTFIRKIERKDIAENVVQSKYTFYGKEIIINSVFSDKVNIADVLFELAKQKLQAA